MKTLPEYKLQEICGEQVVTSSHGDGMRLDRLIVFNASAAYLWQAVAGKNFTAADLARLLCQAYDVALQQAEADAEAVLRQWLEQGLVSDQRD